MLAHAEEVRHIHPHAAGAPWELLALIAVLAVAGALVVARSMVVNKPAAGHRVVSLAK